MCSYFVYTLLVAVLLRCSVEEVAGKENWDLAQSLIEHILLENFTKQGPVLLVMSSAVQDYDFPRFMDAQDLPRTIQWLEEMTLKFIYEKSLWPVKVFKPERDESSFDDVPKVVNNGYIMFVNPQNEEFEDVFSDSIQTLQSKSSWNSRSKFLIVAYGELSNPPTVFAEIILGTLTFYDNVNSVLLLFSTNLEKNNSVENEDEKRVTSSVNITSLYAYTLFPYLNGECNKKVPSLIGRWSLNNHNECNIIGVEYFPARTPHNLMGCTLKLSSLGPEPYVIKENYTREDGGNGFVVTGICVELVLLLASVMNFTIEFLEPIVELKFEPFLSQLIMLQSGDADIMTGLVYVAEPLASMVDISVPILFDSFKFLIPCPRPIEKLENFITLFSLSTWLSMGLVFIIVSILLWCMAIMSLDESNFSAFTPLAQSFIAAWAVLLGISVSRMPVTIDMRCLFIIYVWYCFAMSTVFQAFFTTYLVEPRYEARIETVDDAVRAGLELSYFDIVDVALSFVQFHELDRVKRVMFTNLWECTRNVMFDRETFTINPSYFPKYLASVEGFQDESKIVCFMEKSIVFLSLGVALRKGSPLLSRLNKILMRCMQSGLLEMYWSRLKHKVNLKAIVSDEDSEYVVFSLTHLGPIFILLGFGYFLSMLVFLIEVLFKQFQIKKDIRRRFRRFCN